jgi:hypothetical protein
MHAGFQFVFGSFLSHRFAGAASISCIFDICKGLELLRNRQGIQHDNDHRCRATQQLSLVHQTAGQML